MNHLTGEKQDAETNANCTSPSVLLLLSPGRKRAEMYAVGLLSFDEESGLIVLADPAVRVRQVLL